MKKQKKLKQTGFIKYANTEKDLLKNLAEDFYIISSETLKRKNEVPIFAENTGSCQLFSVAEAAKFHNEAKAIFGHENAKYVQLKIENSFKLGNRRNLAKAPSIKVIKQLRDGYPNFSEAIDIIDGACALSHLSENGYLHISPLLLLGPPGIGKTAFVQSLSKFIGVHFSRIDIGTSSSAAILAGLSLTWGSGRCGEIFNLLTESEYLNPIVMLDEIDKAVGNYAAPIEPILLSLLESESSSSFKDEAIQLKMNAAHIIWIATANYKEQISAPLLSRFSVVEIQPPDNEQSKQIVKNIYKNFRNNNSWGSRFNDEIDDEVVAKLSLTTPRIASKLLLQGFGNAAKKNSNKIMVADIQQAKIKEPRSIGFT